MIEVSRTLPVNDGAEPVLRVDDVWEGLVDKAQDPLAYVASMSECTVTERFEGGLVRDVVHAGQPVREVVTFYPKQRVHFVRTHGTARGTIDNEIGHDDAGELTLTFSFRIVVDGVEAGSAAEKEFAAHMEVDYLDAVRTTLKAVRDRVAGATTGISA
ncbi:SRPBCC family protein [Streptomyces sp. NPDC002643]